MRKIESNMLDAIKRGANWRDANTSVDVAGDYRYVYLHNNHIATLHDMDGWWVGHINEDTFAEWPTRTTKSRLNALERGLDLKFANY